MSNQRRRTIDASAKAVVATKTAAPKRRQLSSIPITASEAAAEAANTVKVVVPKAFSLVIDHHHDVKYQAGTYDMPVDHAEHWWSKANGVVLAN